MKLDIQSVVDSNVEAGFEQEDAFTVTFHLFLVANSYTKLIYLCNEMVDLIIIIYLSNAVQK